MIRKPQAFLDALQKTPGDVEDMVQQNVYLFRASEPSPQLWKVVASMKYSRLQTDNWVTVVNILVP